MFSKRFVAVDKDFINVRIRHTSGRFDDAFKNFMIDNATCFINFHFARQRKPVDLWIQGTDAV